jgi:hypothetical protein
MSSLAMMIRTDSNLQMNRSCTMLIDRYIQFDAFGAFVWKRIKNERYLWRFLPSIERVHRSAL